MPHTRHHTPHFILDYFANRELDELYLAVFLKWLAQSMITVFVPIYFLVLGYEFFDIASFFLIYFIVTNIVMYFGMRLCSIFGVKKSMALGTFLIMIFFYLLHLVSLGGSYIPAAFVSGLSSGIYWAAFHLHFTHTMSDRKEGFQVSVFKIIVIITSVLGPLIGGIIIEKISFAFVFGVVGLLLLCSTFPLFLTRDFKIETKGFSLKRIVKADSLSKGLVFQSDGILHITSGIFWPLFIYITLEEIVTLGAIISFSSVFLIFLIFYIGYLADRNIGRTLKAGVYLHAPFWIIRLFLLTPIGMFLSNFFSMASSSAIDISFGKLVYSKAKRSDSVSEYFLFRELHLTIGRILILVVFLFILNLIWVFVLAFFITFMYLLLVKECSKSSGS